MGLRSDETLEAFINKIIRNEDIMEILKLPVIKSTDTEELIDEKRKVLINKYISKTAQIPNILDANFEEKTIDGIVYDEYGKMRLTLSFSTDIKLHNDLFGNPQLDILIYYDNTEINDNDAYKLLDLISDEFSGQNLEIETEEGRTFIRNIRNEGLITQTPIINNYERIGLRFSFFAKLYKLI